MRKVKLPSGAELAIGLAPFAPAKELYQSILSEAKGIELNPSDEIDVNLWKDLLCVMLSSKKVEAALWECMKRSTYNGLKIDDQTFEPAEAREDYLTACMEVAKDNVMPFMKSLYAKYSQVLGNLKTSLA